MTQDDWDALARWPEDGDYSAAGDLGSHWRRLFAFGYLDRIGRLTDAGRAARAT